MSGYKVKVYYIENRATKEIRKFTIETEVATNFEYLGEKIRRIFPSLLRKDFEIFWKDSDDDYLTVSSNEELIYAWESVDAINGTLKLFVKEKGDGQHPRKEEREHPGIICDGCDSTVKGTRFKCTTCHDFDLCSDCEQSNKHPSNHELLCIKLPRTPGGRRSGHGFSQRHPRRFPWRGPETFGRCPPFGLGAYQYPCGPFQRKRCGEDNKHCPKQESDAKRSCPQMSSEDRKHLGEAVGNLAGFFGFDPEVAKCYFITACDDIKANSNQNEEKDETSKEKPVNEKPKEADFEEFVSKVSSTFGIPGDLMTHFLNPFFESESHSAKIGDEEKFKEKNDPKKEKSEDQEVEFDSDQESKEKTSVNFEVEVDQKLEGENEKDDSETKQEASETEKEASKSKEDVSETKEEASEIQREISKLKEDESETTTERSKSEKHEQNNEFKQELENMVKNFSEQLGLPSDTQQNIQGGLESLLQGMFNFQQPTLSQESNKKEKEEEPRKPDDFVFVDETKHHEPKLTDEEKFQINLNEALDKMIAMGFDNDGGWLSQLLMSKDLSIDRVLEALNPSS